MERKTCLFKNCTQFKICYTLPLPSSPFPPQNTYSNLHSITYLCKTLLVARNLMVTMIPHGFSVFFFLCFIFCSYQLNGAPEWVVGLDTLLRQVTRVGAVSLVRMWWLPWLPSRYHRLQSLQQTVARRWPCSPLSFPPALQPCARGEPLPALLSAPPLRPLLLTTPHRLQVGQGPSARSS